MSRIEAWSFHVSNALVASSGIVYAWMIWWVEPADEYALANHPWQSQVQHAHVLAAPLLVFLGGLLWQRHVWPRVSSGTRARRASGWSLIVALAPMVLSGYLLQVAVEERWRSVWSFAHVVSSCLWLAGSVAHVAARLWPRGRRAVAREGVHESLATPRL